MSPGPQATLIHDIPATEHESTADRNVFGNQRILLLPRAPLREAANVESTIQCTIGSLLGNVNTEGVIGVVSSDEDFVERASHFPLSFQTYCALKDLVHCIGVTDNFKEVIRYFHVPPGETPAGFRITLSLERDNLLRLDLVRNIAYERNSVKRPTAILFSADTANPYEVEPVKNLIANLTCNPGIIYDLFLNDPQANINNRFHTRDEVMQELGSILGSGVDVSVELNNPFSSSRQEILDEVFKFEEILSEYRLVIKVPHTGPVNTENLNELLTGDKRLHCKFDDVPTVDAFRGHNLALFLREHGFRVNFTLMFEPYQAALALQAKPYFINSFVRHRNTQSKLMKRSLDLFAFTGEAKFLEDLRTMFVDKDYLPPQDKNLDLLKVKQFAEQILRYRKFDTDEGADGLDAVRHNLRLLRSANLPETRLIVCSMEGDTMYPEIDQLFADSEFTDMMDRLVLTAEPHYLAQFTTCNQVISYQRRFLNAAHGQR